MRLKPSHQIFVEHYLKTGNGAESSRVAGYSEKNATNSAAQLLKHPTIKAALAEARAGAVVAASYGLDAAMRETDLAIEFAKLTKNANAMVKAIELKTKLNGLLVERVEHKVAGFVISISGIDDLDKLPEAARPNLPTSGTIVVACPKQPADPCSIPPSNQTK